MNRQRSPIEPVLHHVESIPFDGHLVLIKDDRELIVLNETARLMWEALADGATVADLASEMVERFGLTRDHAEADIEAALAAWRAGGLLEHEARDRPPVPRRSGPPSTPPVAFALERTYALCGHPVRFRFRDPDLEHLLCPLLAPSEVGDAAVAEVIDLYRDGGDHVIAANGSEIGRCGSAEEVLELALGRVLEVSYPDAHWLAMFHAGVVADDSHAIVLPGPSGNGKSTLTAALVHAGFRYLSDDVAPLDARTLHVMPMPFAVSLKQGSWPVLAPRFPDLERAPTFGDGRRQRRYLDMSSAAGGRAAPGVPVRALVFPQHRSDGPTRIEPARPGEALGRLLQAGGWVSLDRQDLSRMLSWLMATPLYKLTFDSTDEACALVAGCARSLGVHSCKATLPRREVE